MSTKDLMDRLQTRSPRKTATQGAGARSRADSREKAEVKRVSSKVVRRRRKAPPAPPPAKDLPRAGAPTPAAAEGSRAAIRGTTPPRRQAPPRDPAAGRTASPTERAPSRAEAPPAGTPAREPARPAPRSAASPEPAASREPAASPEPAAAPTPPPSEARPPSSPPAGEKAPTEVAPPAGAEPARAPAGPAAAAPGGAAPSAEPPAPRPSEPPAPRPSPPPQEEPARPPQAEGRPELPRLPGLGRAVVKPPPGYDPTNPRGSIARLQRQRAAAESSSTSGPPTGRSGATGRGRGGGSGRGAPPRGRGRGGRRRGGRVEAFMDDMPMMRRKRSRRSSAPKTPSPRPKAEKRKIQVDNTISVGQLAHEMGLKSKEVIKALMGMGVMATINQQLDFETAQLVAQEFEYEVVNVGFQEEAFKLKAEAPSEDAPPRPPVVTVMGHVDHGKTTLLDAIRRTNVAEREAGGITQHIGAYQVEHGDGLITFIDTPGHEAFTAMRARGAAATDIVVLVVAADDGVMPQTIESINHAKAAGVPIVVAVNKCDKPGVNPEVIRQRLMEHGLVAEEFGGDTLMVNVSALEGEGLDELLGAIQLVAELQELRADPDRHAEGFVLEARLEQGRGPVATLLVKAGTLHVGDPLVIGATWGKVRAMTDHRGKRLKEAGPSMPMEVIGLESVPEAGEQFEVVKSEKAARTLAEHRARLQREEALATRQKVSLQDLFKKAREGEEVKSLNIIVKGDVQGSVEALRSALTSLDVEGTEVEVLHAAVGKVTESDVTLAATYDALIIGFNVRPDAKARKAALEHGVEIRTYKVIYEALDDIRRALAGLLGPIEQEQHQGAAEVRAVFQIPKVGAIAGCMVTEGVVSRNHHARLTRDGVVVWEGRVSSLKRFKDDVREVRAGFECGIGLEGFNDLKVGDEIEFYTVELVEQQV